MTTRVLLSVALGGNLLAQEPGDPDYVPDPEAVDEYERLGEEEGSDYDLDGDAFDEAADQAGLNAPQVLPPTGSEIDEFRAGLEAHWGGNLPALWAYLDSIDPAGGDNPEPHWEPDAHCLARVAFGQGSLPHKLCYPRRHYVVGPHTTRKELSACRGAHCHALLRPIPRGSQNTSGNVSVRQAGNILI